MTIHDHEEFFADLPVRNFNDQEDASVGASFAWRIALDWQQVDDGMTFEGVFDSFLMKRGADQVTALIIGDWGHAGEGDASKEVIDHLVKASKRLGAMRALFVGEITYEESEISWIHQSDVSPVLQAYPRLEVLRLRGGIDLSLGPARHATLRSLVIETGGLPPNILTELASSDLPQLEHLELWLGDSGYGWGSSMDDLAPVLSGRLFPKLQYLGLRDSEVADEVAAAVAQSPLLERISVLDLSLGTLGDAGAAALAKSPAVGNLKLLDVSHHYLSKDGLRALKDIGIQIRADDGQGDGDERYVAVAE
ncbi:MAG: STM4015 family protein [Planctomycetaceae bacterium]|nr:STM4015 family protein [Planctomycetaceae bacterium]